MVLAGANLRYYRRATRHAGVAGYWGMVLARQSWVWRMETCEEGDGWLYCGVSTVLLPWVSAGSNARHTRYACVAGY